jgi:hypothetical protein
MTILPNRLLFHWIWQNYTKKAAPNGAAFALLGKTDA